MGSWPLYRENTLQGPSHVSLAIPGKPSAISKSVNGTQPALLLVPNLDYLKSFVNGDVGIANNIITSSLFANINSPASANNEMVARKFAEVNSLGLGDVSKYKKDGKIRIPKSEIKLPPEYDMNGLKGLEKTMLKSIFETQKPYMEIAKIVVDLMVGCEDIVARVMPLLSANPLRAKSEKPGVKDGSQNGARAIGYKNGEDIKKILAELQKTASVGGKTTVNADGTVRREKPAAKGKEGYGETDPEGKSLAGTGREWRVVNVVYSTGLFDPNVKYTYTYNILPPDDEGTAPDPEAQDEDNPFDKHKPKRIILGLFDTDGNPLDPNKTLKAIGADGTELTKVDTPIKSAEWILRSPKWKFAEGQYRWPSMGAAGSAVYLWVNAIGATTESKTSPGKGWSIKRYAKGQKNVINGVDAIEGDPVIARFEAADAAEYQKYFTEYAALKAKKADGLTQQEKDQAVKDVMAGFDTQSHMQNVLLYGSTKASTYKTPIPEALKVAFKPHQIYVPSAASDPNLSGDGMVWVDPESDYDLKVIRIDPVSKVDYEEAKGEPAITADVKSFVKNRMVFTLSNGEKFNVTVSKNGQAKTEITGVTEYAIENWNYEGGKILNQNEFEVTIWSESPGPRFSDGKNRYELTGRMANAVVQKNKDGRWTFDSNTSSGNEDGMKILDDKSKIEVEKLAITKWYYLHERKYDWRDLPKFGSEITNVLQYDTVGRNNAEPTVAATAKQIPLYRMRVNNPSDPYGVVVDPANVRNEALTTAELFSKGRYGAGTPESPQEIEVLKRYALTDLDTKSYYLIEGILIDENAKRGAASSSGGATNADESGDSSGKWYRLPHAIGAAVVFLKIMVKIATKLVPAIKKLINLFKDPTKFVTDTIEEKLGESFGIFSKESFQKLKEAQGVMSRKGEIVGAAGRVSDYTGQLKGVIKSSPLANHVHVQEFSSPGRLVTIPDGTAMIPFEIFGKSLPFGMELKLGNLVPEGNAGLAVPKSPFRLIKGARPSAKAGDSPGQESTQFSDPGAAQDAGKTNADYLSQLNSPAVSQNARKRASAGNQNDNYTTTTWYSTGRFIKGVDYNYIYVTDDTARLVAEVDELLAVPTQENLALAAERLDGALKKDPDNEALKEKQKELRSKQGSLASLTQPLLKLLLGAVTMPISVIAKVVEWLMGFFKSLTNPLKLPAKIIEFLSFKWIMEFFSPKGLLKIAGIEFNPGLAKEYAEISKRPNSPGFSASGASAKDKKGGFPNPDKNRLKGLAPHKGKYAVPDNFPLADLSKVIKISFMASLPTYTSRSIRENPDISAKFSGPILCFLEKVINAFIDFVWSTLGIEAIMAPPHIKLCKEKTPEDTSALLNGEKPTSATDGTTEVVSTDPYEEKSATDAFMYEVKLPDGRVVTLMDKEALDKFIKENKDISYDFQF